MYILFTDLDLFKGSKFLYLKKNLIFLTIFNNSFFLLSLLNNLFKSKKGCLYVR